MNYWGFKRKLSCFMKICRLILSRILSCNTKESELYVLWLQALNHISSSSDFNYTFGIVCTQLSKCKGHVVFCAEKHLEQEINLCCNTRLSWGNRLHCWRNLFSFLLRNCFPILTLITLGAPWIWVFCIWYGEKTFYKGKIASRTIKNHHVSVILTQQQA